VRDLERPSHYAATASRAASIWPTITGKYDDLRTVDRERKRRRRHARADAPPRGNLTITASSRRGASAVGFSG
jgi:hypothetical protein